MSSWTDLLRISTNLVEQTAPYPPLQRNLDQIESLSKKLKAKALRTDAPSQSIAATRLLAREGLNGEQLARGLKSLEFKKSTSEDVFQSEATSVEEYLQQVHETTLVSAVQEAQKDNISSFNDYMMKIMEEDWLKEKRDFLQRLSGISTLPKTKFGDSITSNTPSQIVSTTPHLSMNVTPLVNKPFLEKKTTAYAEVVKSLNRARENALPFKPAMAFKDAYEHLEPASGGKFVSIQKIWHLVQTLLGEDNTSQNSLSKRWSLIIGARRHLEWGHEKYIIDTIQSHPTQAALGGTVGVLQRVHAFLRIRMRDYGILDFDASDIRRQPPVDTTWQQIYYCLRSGYYDEAKNVALSSRVSSQFGAQLTEWITSGGMVSAGTAEAASEECERMLRMGDGVGGAAYDKKKLLLYAMLSGSHRQIDGILRELPAFFSTIEDFLWFALCAVKACSGGSSSVILNEGLIPYSLEDLQAYLNKFEPSYYTKKGKDPLLYPYVLLLSIQFLPAILHLFNERGDEGCNVDAIHISIAFADHGVLSEGGGAGQQLGMMDACAEISSLIRQYGSECVRVGNLSNALEYFAQAAAAVGGGELSWIGRGSADQQRQRNLMLKQLLTQLLLRDGGIYLLLGSRGGGEEGELVRFLGDVNERQQFLLEAACQGLEAGLYDKSIEIQKRIGAYSMALGTVNKCISDAICGFCRGRSDAEGQIFGLIESGNEILKSFKENKFGERESVLKEGNVLRELEAVASVHKLSRMGRDADALRALVPFISMESQTPELRYVFQALSPHVQVCFPDLLRVALSCLDNMGAAAAADNSLLSLRTKIANFLATNTDRNWPRDLYDKVSLKL